MRQKHDTFEVENPAKAMEHFTSLLGKLVKVPKAEVEKYRAKAKKKRMRRKLARR